MTLMKNKSNDQLLLEELEDYSRILDQTISIDAEHLNRTVLHRAYIQGRIENIKKAKVKD